MSEQKNLIIAAGLSFLVIGLWEVFVAGPQRAEMAERRAMTRQEAPVDGAAVPTVAPQAGGIPSLTPAAIPATRDDALATGGRVPFDTPSIDGSIALTGGRIDDLSLKKYRETVEPDAPEVTVLSPTGGPDPFYAVFGWIPAAGTQGELPGPKTRWQVIEGQVLTPESPVTLGFRNENGLEFRRRYSVDERYLFTIEQSVTNTGTAQASLAPYGIVARHGEPDVAGFYILHEGAIGAADGKLTELDYGDLDDLGADAGERAQTEKITVSDNGWIGFTDKYWMTTLIPEPGQAFTAVYKRVMGAAGPVYQTDARLPVMTVGPGQSASTTLRLFSGAKQAETISDYQEAYGIEMFYDSIDWGWFAFLTKPFFWLLNNIYKIVGNFGVAIILFTVIVKAVVFPLSYKSYVSMSRMKKVQPQMEKIRERHKDDPQGMQRAMMELYKKEKVNPAAGCLPILIQIPIFFSLYKVLFVTIEMRHAPFFGWIRDLSAPDPTSFLNLFGALPWEIQDGTLLKTLGIGIWPIIMGITMWLQMQLNPAPADPVQKKIFAWMPIIFTFMLGSFAAGLVIYWTANNILTLIQQGWIMRSQGVKIELLDNIKRQLRLGKKDA